MNYLRLLPLLLLFLLSQTGYGQGRRRNFLEAATHGKYKPGWYTLRDGTRHAGRLRIWQTLTRNLVQVEKGKADPLNISPEELRHFTMGADSFVVARQGAVAGMPSTNPFGDVDFYRVVLTGKLQVLEHDQLVPGQGGYGPAHSLTWALRPAGETDVVVLPTEETAFAQFTAGFFSDYPPLAQRIRAGLVGYADFKRIMYAYVFRREIEQVTYEQAATIFR
ncbi:hypothetical protein ACFQT0_18850 [Hymenobacter humi]|uniref:Cyclic nucleotide-binding domain-containing protein n=1 Tax=Hymenobacter humi TaxID=1411620 RepID=A0ABW2U6S1_9BACT